MAIQQTKRQSDLEKRLQLLRRQVYGREPVVSSKYQNTHTTNYLPADATHQALQAGQIPIPTNLIRRGSSMENTIGTTDITYLHQDLLKILIFASCAIGGQVILFFLLKNHILNLVFR